jgi:hypothetical protein
MDIHEAFAQLENAITVLALFRKRYSKGADARMVGEENVQRDRDALAAVKTALAAYCKTEGK